ncbi:hypothetical protein DPPLL_28060 [Desulfofustis limnaeus]|uniref:HAMP domain-containing protein n=2 Tax=Desulfofustis limnaeus TaxID=2740163 RepID=A0ABM7WBQ3_9BACT|nr:hypothetical protein DPPLL_28060 [Desulfofustis limnaeus]
MITLSLVTLLLVSLYYVIKQVISPLETIDRELNRIGALAHDELFGNEIKRLSGSVKKLERAMADRNLAEVEREKTIRQLREALEQIKTLKGFIPICAGCKKIRDDQGYWEQLESYLAAHTDATFSHGLCPECFEKAMAELDSK